MRWDGQQVGADGVGHATALPGMRGLLRSVRTPGFADTVFHEVEARSVLNRVPSSSPVPFGWTVNPYRGCSHACTYCLVPDTPVLTADGRSRPIGELRPGDEVVGTLADGGGRRRFVRTPVLARWSTRRRAQEVILDDGTVLVTSAEHRFLTTSGWAHVRPGRCRSSADRPHLAPGTALVGPGAAAVPGGPRPDGYAEGWLCGLVRADAVRGRVRAEPFPTGWVELEALARAHHLLTARPVPVAAGMLAAPAPSPTAWPHRPARGWSAGFVGGIVDACGEVSAGVLRIVPGEETLARACVDALRRLGFRVASEPSARPGVRALRVLGGVAEQLRLVAVTDPAVARMRDVGGARVEEPPGGSAAGGVGPRHRHPPSDGRHHHRHR
ncbi:hypothetical protein [Pseudonocardia sp. HH130629-09]|uniref:hypothetical protein n=1 Tax=Pseudonocardia sp. HH130629-09 TaxID=1641402 RepID=UPI0014393016|nr:hypothetical protein [Pseudonocardia sp. HH130629-09]